MVLLTNTSKNVRDKIYDRLNRENNFMATWMWHSHYTRWMWQKSEHVARLRMQMHAILQRTARENRLGKFKTSGRNANNNQKHETRTKQSSGYSAKVEVELICLMLLALNWKRWVWKKLNRWSFLFSRGLYTRRIFILIFNESIIYARFWYWLDWLL